MTTLLAIDIGNTNITLGLYQENEPHPKKEKKLSSALHPFLTHCRLLKTWRLSTRKSATADEYGCLLRQLFVNNENIDVDQITLASVVPPLTTTLKQCAKTYFGIEAQELGVNLPVPIKNKTKEPKLVGIDRLVNAYASWQMLHRATIVVDFGTATTFDCVNAKGEYIGGAIVPGPQLAAESLSLRTAQLPKVQMAKPPHIIGKNTVESIESGLYYGYISLVDGMITRLKKELGKETQVLATGGLAEILSRDSKFIHVANICPSITLDGIAAIHFLKL